MILATLLKTIPFCAICLAPFSAMAIGESNPNYTVIDDKTTLKLLSPTFSERKTQKIKLANGLQAYLVSDPKLDKSGAVLSVRVGSWDNPPEYMGLAHFLEHLLFLGTKKYPNESEYQRFIHERSGLANAYTDSDHTSYMFSIEHNGYKEAIDRFAYFFKEPLFNPSGVTRELQAVDQEFSKQVIDDDWRLYYIQKELSSKQHPFHVFATGNVQTLSHVDQDYLKKWYAEHYSANLMHLAVYSNLPMNELTDLVVQNFKDIPNHDRKALSINVPISTKDSEGHLVYVESLKDKRTLHITWDMPIKFAEMRLTKPEQLIGYVLAHEGKESLLEVLKKENLAQSIHYSGSLIGGSNLELDVVLELTDQGVKKIDDVIAKVFQTIELLKSKEFPSYLFNEIKKMAVLNYEYQSRDDVFNLVRREGSLLLREELATYPERSYVIQEFDPKAVGELLSLMTPQKATYYLQAPSKITGIISDRSEKWLGGNFSVKEISAATLQKWSTVKPDPQIDFPEPNELIPRDLFLIDKEDVVDGDAPFMPVPEAIQNNDQGLIYFSQDYFYDVPQTSYQFYLKTPFTDNTNSNKIVLTELYIQSLQAELNRYTYLSNLAGLNYQIVRKENGIEISINGYSDNSSVLLNKIIEQLNHVTPKEDEFNSYKNALTRTYENAEKNMPYEQGMEFLKSFLIEKYVTNSQKANAVKRVTFAQFNQFAKKIFTETYIEGLIYGNINKPQSTNILENIFKTLNTKPYLQGRHIKPKVVSLPEGSGPYYHQEEISTPGYATILAVEYGKYDFKLRAAQQILMQAMKQSFFATLRTKQQTGYIVKSGSEDIESQLFNIFLVQSNSHASRDLLSRFELFIESYLQELKDEITQEKFTSIKASLIDVLEQPPKNLKEMSDLLNTLAFKYDGAFDWVDDRIQAFKDLSYNEFIELSIKYMGKQNKKRLAILVEGPQEGPHHFNYSPLKRVVLKKKGEFVAFRDGYKKTKK